MYIIVYSVMFHSENIPCPYAHACTIAHELVYARPHYMDLYRGGDLGGPVPQQI